MFHRASNYNGTHRERIAAIGIAHSLYAQLHPAELQNMQLIKSTAIREKVAVEKQQQLLDLEHRVTSIVLDVINQAIKDGDIPQDKPHLPDSILFGLWSMSYGSNLLHMSGIPFDKLGMQQPLDMMWQNSHRLLDSYQWQPLSETFDIDALRTKLCNELFSEEMQQLNTDRKK